MNRGWPVLGGVIVVLGGAISLGGGSGMQEREERDPIEDELMEADRAFCKAAAEDGARPHGDMESSGLPAAS